MTKQDYIALAAVLNTAKPVFTGDKDSMEYMYYEFCHQQWVSDVRAITEACAKGNPKFNKGKFIAACGIPNILDDGITAEMHKVVVNYHKNDDD
jgi:hypothetical protein